MRLLKIKAVAKCGFYTIFGIRPRQVSCHLLYKADLLRQSLFYLLWILFVMSGRRNGMDNSRTYMLNYKQIIFRIHMKRKMRLILSYSLGQMKTEEFEKTSRHCKKRKVYALLRIWYKRKLWQSAKKPLWKLLEADWKMFNRSTWKILRRRAVFMMPADFEKGNLP